MHPIFSTFQSSLPPSFRHENKKSDGVVHESFIFEHFETKSCLIQHKTKGVKLYKILGLIQGKMPYIMFSFGYFPGVWIIYADVSEHSICSIFIGRWYGTSYHLPMKMEQIERNTLSVPSS